MAPPSLSSPPPPQVACPSCDQSVPYAKLNAHLDRCLSGQNQHNAGSNGSSSQGPAASGTGLFGTMMKKGARKRKAESDDEGQDGYEVISSRKDTIAPGTATQVKKEENSSAPSIGVKSAGQPHSMKDRMDEAAPLAERARPMAIEDYVGQEDIVEGPVAALLKQGRIPSMILWGPPGTGKTTLARLLAKTANDHLTNHTSSTTKGYRFVEVSATTAGTAEMKKIFTESLSRLQLTGQKTVLFIDEIQRFSKSQQDVFLPVVEKGSIILIAATTENPSFRLQSALISRMRVFVLKKLTNSHILQILTRARDQFTSKNSGGACGDSILEYISSSADGDARTALQALEIAMVTVKSTDSDSTNLSNLKSALRRQALYYDRKGDMHYDTISALHKSIRGSDPDASLYWLARMVHSGEDPLFIARRLIVAASEDINTVEALNLAIATYQACQLIGLPECGENLAQCVITLSEAKKSTRSYRAWKKALALCQSDTFQAYPVPLHIRNAPTKLMKELNYGKEYRYEPRFAHPIHQEFFPPELKGTRFVSPEPDQEQRQNDDSDSSDIAGTSNSGTSLLYKGAGQGPGSCQRIFNIGARVVDYDLLQEWEQERNSGKQWEGRAQLDKLVAKQGQQQHSASGQEIPTAASVVVQDDNDGEGDEDDIGREFWGADD
ncbi:unnamed protein product [Sympodiomycopsis kandeliae]